MGRVVDGVVSLVARVLPRITAHAVCGTADTWYEYRCITSGCARLYQRRRCSCCPLCCGSWTTIGCCGGTCC